MNAGRQLQQGYGLGRGLGTALRDAVLLTTVASVLGLLVNLFHPERIPYLAEQPYRVLVPCPEPVGEAGALSPAAPQVRAADSLVVDARPAADYAAWHLPGAYHLVFDYLEPVPQQKLDELTRLLGERRARRLVVYGDGGNPDCGEQLARELSGRGLRNVFYVRGGAPALRGGQAAARPGSGAGEDAGEGASD